MIGAGLSLDQAPPISAPLRFLLTAPVFIVFAGLVLFFNDISLVRNDTGVIALVHIFTLGVFSMVMFGAIQQMLPVLAGVRIRNALLVARSSHLFLVMGVLLFSYSFLSEMSVWSVRLASFFLFLSFVIVLGSALYALKDTDSLSATVKAMIIASLAGLMTMLLGGWILHDYLSSFGNMHQHLAQVHMIFGLFGFAGILIIGVAFKIIPMFYVAPEFKDFCQKRVIPLILLGIVVWMTLSLFSPEYQWIGLAITATFFAAFGVTVNLKLSKRRRPTSDVTLWYWRTAASTLVIGMILWIYSAFLDANMDVYLAVLIGGGFILSVITGMLYKIVPFLVWFHLNAKGHFEIPTMREMLNEKMAKIQYAFHLLSMVSISLGSYMEIMIKVAAVALIVSGVLIIFNLFKAVKVYEKMKNVDPMGLVLNADTPVAKA